MRRCEQSNTMFWQNEIALFLEGVSFVQPNENSDNDWTCQGLALKGRRSRVCEKGQQISTWWSQSTCHVRMQLHRKKELFLQNLMSS